MPMTRKIHILSEKKNLICEIDIPKRIISNIA